MLRFLFASLVVAWPAHALAAPGDATRLEYARSAGAASCPDRDALQGAVVKRLGYDPFFHAARQTVSVEITDAEGGLRAQMHLVDEKGLIVGSRELRERTGHCDELVASLALAISIALDPSAAMGEQRAAEPAASEPAAPPSEPSPPPPPPARPSAPPPAPRIARQEQPAPSIAPTSAPLPIAVRLAGFGALGAAPAPAAGFRVGGSLNWQSFKLIAELADQLPASNSEPHVGGAEASRLSLTLLPCLRYRSLAGCAAFAAGRLHLRGTEILDASSTHELDLEVGARFELTPTLVGGLRLLVGIDIMRSLTPVSLRVHAQEVWATPKLSASAALGLEWQFR